jgi:hypothetical protein
LFYNWEQSKCMAAKYIRESIYDDDPMIDQVVQELMEDQKKSLERIISQEVIPENIKHLYPDGRHYIWRTPYSSPP